MLQCALDLLAFDYPYCAEAELLIVKFAGSEWIAGDSELDYSLSNTSSICVLRGY